MTGPRESTGSGGGLLRIIFIEDHPQDEELARRTLERAGYHFNSLRVETKSDFAAAVKAGVPDLVISDYAMPQWDGMAALRLVREMDPFLPFIVLTGLMNEDTAVECMKAGANDYVIKEHMTRLPFAVREALSSRKTRREAASAELRLAESEERYRSIFRDSGAAILIVDPDDGTIFDANPSACATFGVVEGGLAGVALSTIAPVVSAWLEKAIEDSHERHQRFFHLLHRAKAVGDRDFEIHASRFKIKDREFVNLLIHDVSEQVRAEKDRNALTQRLSHYLRTSPTITYSFRIEGGKAVWQWVSDNVERILGYTPEEALEPDWWLRHVHPEDRTSVIQGLGPLVRSDSLSREYRFTTKDRNHLWLLDELRILRKEDGSTEVVGTLTDVSGGKAAAAELALKSAALDAADNAVVITDREGNLLWLNSAFERLSGYSRSEALGRNPRELLRAGFQGREVYRRMWETILDGRGWRGQIVNRRKSGALYVEEMTITPVLDKAGRVSNFVAVKEDVTEREDAMKRLEAMNRENLALVREVHHRVNNNMQIISSLLHLSTGRGGKEAFAESVLALDRRVQSMALIHRQFYESETMARIDFSIAIRNIVDGIREEWPETAGRIDISFDTEPIELDIERAILAGLIVAELVANSFEHAFPDRSRRGTLVIAMRAPVPSRILIEVRDDGAGLPADFDFDKASTLGMIFIASLANQLRGEVAFSGGSGTAVSLGFPASQKTADSARLKAVK